MAEGAKQRLELRPSPDVTDVRIIDSQGARTWREDDGAIGLRFPYGVTTVAVTLELVCSGGTVERELSFEVRPLRWSRAAEWKPGVDGPTAREYFSWWWSTKQADTLLMYGGFLYQPRPYTAINELWSFNVSTGKWSPVRVDPSAPALAGTGSAPSEAGGELIFGGLDAKFETPSAIGRLVETATGASWSNVSLAESSDARADYQPAFFYDAPRKRHLSVCGQNTQVGYHCEVNAFVDAPGGGRWEKVSVAAGPKPLGRAGFFWVHDVATDRLIIFSGDASTSAQVIRQDTWALELAEDPVRWVQLSEGETPEIGRRNGAAVLDPVNHRMLVWGGTFDGLEPVADLYVLDLDRGFEKWKRVKVAGSPDARASGQAIYDAKNRRVLAGFGNTAAKYFADLWSLEL